MKRWIVLACMVFLLPTLSHALIQTWQIQDYSIRTNDMADSSVGTRVLGADVVTDAKLNDEVQGRVFVTLYYDGVLCNTAGIAGGGIIIKEPANGMTGSVSIERATAISYDTMTGACSICLSCDGGATYDTLTFLVDTDSAVLTSFTNFATWASGAKINIRISNGSNAQAEKVNFIIQGSHIIGND